MSTEIVYYLDVHSSIIRNIIIRFQTHVFNSGNLPNNIEFYWNVAINYICRLLINYNDL